MLTLCKVITPCIVSFSPVFWWRICQIREPPQYFFFQGLEQRTADAGSGGKSHSTVGRALSRQPLLPLDKGRKAAVIHHSSQPLPERPAWGAASLRPCPEPSSNNDRSGKAPQKSELPSSPDRQLSFHLTPTLEAEEVQQSPAASAQRLARAHMQEAPADEHHHSLLACQGLTAEHVSEGAQPLLPCPPSLCAPSYDRPEAEQAAPREQAAVPAPANAENPTQVAGAGTAAGLSPSSIARDLPATEVQERPTQLPMVLCTLLEALPAEGGEACPAQLPQPQAMTVQAQSAGGVAMPCAAQIAEGAAAAAKEERPCSAQLIKPQALGEHQDAHRSDKPCAAEMGEVASVPLEENHPCPGQLPEPQAVAVQAQDTDSSIMRGALELAEATAVVPEDEMPGPAHLPAPQQLVAHRQDAGDRARPGPVQDGEAAELHAEETRARPAQLAAPQGLAMQSQGSDGKDAAGARQDDAAGKLQDECGLQAEPQKGAEMQPLRSGRDAAPKRVQPEVQGLTFQQARKQGDSSNAGCIGSGGAQEAMAKATHEGSRPSSPLPPAEPALHKLVASPLSAGPEGAAPAESPKALLSPVLAVAAASVLLSVQVGSNSSSLQ